MKQRTVLEDLERLLGFGPEADKIVRRAMRAYKTSKTLAENKATNERLLHNAFLRYLGPLTFRRVLEVYQEDERDNYA